MDGVQCWPEGRGKPVLTIHIMGKVISFSNSITGILISKSTDNSGACT